MRVVHWQVEVLRRDGCLDYCFERKHVGASGGFVSDTIPNSATGTSTGVGSTEGVVPVDLHILVPYSS